MEAYVSVFKEEVRCWQTGASVHYEMLGIQKKTNEIFYCWLCILFHVIDHEMEKRRNCD